MTATLTIEKAPVVDEATGVKTFEKEIDQTAAENGVDVTELFKNANEDSDENTVVKATFENGDVIFDKAAIEAIASAENATFTIAVTVVDENSVENENFAGAEMIIEVSLGGVTFEEGKATISVDFDKEIPEGKIGKVYYVDDNGVKTDMNATFSNGKATFTTNHFSTYVVIFEDLPETSGGLSAGAIVGIALGCAVFAGMVAVAVIFFLKKKKEKQN